MGGHVLVLGETQSGKTYYSNQLHRQSHGVSIFWNTKGEADLWGEHVQSTRELQVRVKEGSRKFVWNPPRDKKAAEAKLTQLETYLYRHATPGTPPWCQIVIDEAQLYPESGESLARLSLGRGIQCVFVTQYPTGLAPGIRANCPNRVIFRPGIEGTKFLRDYGYYPYEEIMECTAKPYHFASYAPARGWQYHGPV